MLDAPIKTNFYSYLFLVYFYKISLDLLIPILLQAVYRGDERIRERAEIFWEPYQQFRTGVKPIPMDS